MAEHKILWVSSNHPAVRPGGMESYSIDLYDAFRKSDDFEPLFIARAGPPFTEDTPHHGWSPFSILEDDPNQYLFYTNTFADLSQYDPLFGRWSDNQVLTRFFRDFLLAHEPDLVHFQHTAYLGYDALSVTRNTLPDAPIVCTLHDYHGICHRDGQMLRTESMELCREETPLRCHECFPDIGPETFHERKRFIQSHMSLVDYFVTPSKYVRDRYVEWGIPPEKIRAEPYGMVPVTDRRPEEHEPRPRNRFGFFGQLNPYKGADVLLEAFGLLGDDFDGRLSIFGANLEIQPPEFREHFRALLEAERQKVSFPGPYDRSQLSALMASIDWVVVPSIWWETGPIVVMEAFQYGRPVICSDVGGMAEKVVDGVNGLHFRRRDSEDLARVLRRAAETPGLWDLLRAGIPPEPFASLPFRSMDDHVEVLRGIYRRLLDARGTGGRATVTDRVAGA